MKLIYVNQSERQSVDTDKKYKRWLEELKEGDLIMVQSFHSPSKAYFDFDLEFWQLEVRQFYSFGDRYVVGTQGRQSVLDKTNGCLTDGVDPLGGVFPIRVVPLASTLFVEPVKGTIVYGNFPIYEPLFVAQTRHVYFVGRKEKDRWKKDQSIRTAFEIQYGLSFISRCYTTDCNGGTLYHCFGESENPLRHLGLKPLYSTDIVF